MSTILKISNCAALLLAAGASSRLGKPKQLLLYKGKTLLQNALSAALDAQLDPVIIVLGADESMIRSKVDEKNIHTAYNSGWQEGIASSIRCGLKKLEKIAPNADAAILMVCDQPHITSSLLKNLFITQQQTGKPIVASYYNDVAGTPALFHKNIFPELVLLKGDKGAGKILRERTGSVATIPFPL